MFDVQSLTVSAGQEVQNSKEVENTSKNSRKAKVDSFVAKLEKDLSLQDSIRGRKYNYLFNDFGLPTVENQPIFVQLYKHSLKLFKDYPLSEDIWENICEDAVEKGVDILESDKYSLGKDFYSYLYNAAIEDCTKIYEQETSDGVAESDRKVRTLGNNIYYYADALKFDELLTSIRNKLSDIATRQLLIDEIKLTKFNTDIKPVEPVIQLIDDIKKPFEKKAEPTKNTDETEVDSDASIQDKFKELDGPSDEPEKPVDESVKKSEITVEELSKSNMKKSILLILKDNFGILVKTKENQEPKQPEPVEDIDNKDKNLESEDKQIDDDLSNEENKDINTETDNSNIEDLSDTDTEETDMRVVKDTVKHEAFGVLIDFDVPDFIKINDDPRWFNVLKNNGYVLERYLDSELANSRLFLFDFSGTKESLNDNIISVYDAVSKKMVLDSVSVLAILYMMANGLAGLNPDSTEQDIMNLILNNKWIKGLLLKYSYLRNRYLVIKAYNPEEEVE